MPSTTQFLLLSPFTPSYTIHNSYLNVSTTVTVTNFDPTSVTTDGTIPEGSRAYVKSVALNGQDLGIICHFDFYDVFRVGGNMTIEVTDDATSVDNCGSKGVPESLSTGGFASAR